MSNSFFDIVLILILTRGMNIYLGNLNYKVKAEDLTRLAEQYGNVANTRIITDRETGRSRGFGFVEMDENDAQAAIEALNEQNLWVVS